MNRRSIIAGAAGLGALGIVGAGLTLSGGPNSGGAGGVLMRARPLDPLTVRGDVGGEKMDFLRNPDVVTELRRTQALTLETRRVGSIEMARQPTPGSDFIWPAHDMSADILRSTGRQPRTEENVFSSPIVVLTWKPVADALAAAGLVRHEGDTLVLHDLARLVAIAVDGRPWSDLGLGGLFGPVGVTTTHPAFSNSGLMWACLAATAMNGGRVPSQDDIERVGPRLRAMLERMGRMEQSSGRSFRQFLSQGMGSMPLLAAYENQLAEHWDGAPDAERRALAERVRVLYPLPTVFATHPILALTTGGVRAVEAMRGPDIRRIAWTRHGFRSPGTESMEPPTALRPLGMPASVGGAAPMPLSLIHI